MLLDLPLRVAGTVMHFTVGLERRGAPGVFGGAVRIGPLAASAVFGRLQRLEDHAEATSARETQPTRA